MDNTLKIAGFSSVFSMQNIFLKKNTDPENQVISFLFRRPIDPIFLLSCP